jgi:predicted nucleotidyltransferase
MNALGIEQTHYHTIQSLLKQLVPETPVWAFGSRVHRRCQKPFSDLDLVLLGDNSNVNILFVLQDSFEESDLPFVVDVSFWSDLPAWLQEQISQEHIPLQL